MNQFIKIILVLIFSTNLNANEQFFTITVCNNSDFQKALDCKNVVLKERKFDVIITKTKNTPYKTNYGNFETINDAINKMSGLSTYIKSLKPFVVKIDRKNSNFEFFEIYPKRIFILYGNIISFLKAKISIKIPDKIKKNFKKELNNILEFEKAKIEAEKIAKKKELTNNKKIAYITFDDGPILATQNILKVLSEEDIKATLFFVGFQIQSNKTIFLKAKNHPNVTLANHTYSHANGRYQKFYSNANSVVDDINKAQSLLPNSKKQLLRLAGRNVFRLPNIKSNDIAINSTQTAIEKLAYDAVYEAGYNIYGWDVEWRFDRFGKPTQTPYEVFRQMEFNLKNKRSKKSNKVILLTHDIMFSDHFNGVENLKALIKLLKDSGWSFDSIKNY